MARSTRPNFRTAPTEPTTGLPAERQRWVAVILLVAFGLLAGRFWWLQIANHDYYENLAQLQYQNKGTARVGDRGKIYDQAGNLLVGNHAVYQLYVQPNQVADAAEFYDTVAPVIAADPEASASLKPRADFLAAVAEHAQQSVYIHLANRVSQTTKETLDELDDLHCLATMAHRCLKFESQLRRYYPEGTLAAQTVGFLSRDNGTGHYGIEGGLDKELSGKTAQVLTSADANGNLTVASTGVELELDGRDVYLTLDRDLQRLVETTLAEGVARFGAERGEIVITQPATGQILAMAAYPSYDPEKYYEADAALYKNPSAYDLYEPGSTFKVLTMAAAIDQGVVSPETRCTNCASARTIGGYTISNWNGVANGAITMTEALEKSDNIALVWVSEQLGVENFKRYLKAFGIGQPLELEVEEQASVSFPEVWGALETANRSFGQGIVVTTLHLARAVGAIANGGQLMKLHLVDRVVDKATGETFVTEPEVITQVISPESAATVARMMQAAAQHGEATYIYGGTQLIAGKTGTAQIPEAGGYSDDTIASFVGFAPYDDPKFLMIVKYERPHTSIYAAETAAVTWKELAEKLFLKFGISTGQG